jgi:hypothetical protein
MRMNDNEKTMMQQSQVNFRDIHPKVVYAVRLRRKRKVKKTSF